MTAPTVLEEAVLVLDKNYKPIEIVTVRDAFNKLCRDSALVLDNYLTYDIDNWIEYSKMVNSSGDTDRIGSYVLTPSLKVLAPDVILLPDYSAHTKHGTKIRYSRTNIFQRDDYRCQYCRKQFGRKELTVDHITPKSRGGSTSWSNIATACKPCNTRKGNKTPEEAGMKLLQQPIVPTWGQTIKLPKGKETWLPYLL